MKTHIRLLAVAAFGLIAGCGDDDGLSPSQIRGVWVYDGPQITNFPPEPDTIVIEGGGRGRVALKWVHEQPPGTEPRYVAEWLRGPLEYRFGDNEVFFRWCPQGTSGVLDCTNEWHTRGTLERDGRMMIGPASMISSLSPLPWKRIVP